MASKLNQIELTVITDNPIQKVELGNPSKSDKDEDEKIHSSSYLEKDITFFNILNQFFVRYATTVSSLNLKNLLFVVVLILLRLVAVGLDLFLPQDLENLYVECFRVPLTLFDTLVIPIVLSDKILSTGPEVVLFTLITVINVFIFAFNWNNSSMLGQIHLIFNFIRVESGFYQLLCTIRYVGLFLKKREYKTNIIGLKVIIHEKQTKDDIIWIWTKDNFFFMSWMMWYSWYLSIRFTLQIFTLVSIFIVRYAYNDLKLNISNSIFQIGVLEGFFLECYIIDKVNKYLDRILEEFDLNIDVFVKFLGYKITNAIYYYVLYAFFIFVTRTR